MKMSVFYSHLREAALQRGLPVEKVLEEAAALGFRGVECGADKLLADPRGFADALNGLEICSAYYRFDFELGIHPERVEEVLDSVLAAGCRRLLAIPGNLVDGQVPEMMVEGLQLLCDLAAQRGIRVTLEDFDAIVSPCATAKGLRYLFDRVPALGFTLDTGNFIYAEEDALEALALLSDRLAHIHLKDRSAVRLTEGDVPCISISGRELYPCGVGDGMLPMEELVKQSAALGFDGWCSAEHFGAAGQWTCITRSAQWMRRILPDA